MDNTETDIGDIGHTKHKTMTNKANQKRNTPPPKKNKKKQKKNKKTPHNKPPTHNTTLKRCATWTPQKTRDEPRCSRMCIASYKTPSVLLI